MNEANDGSFVGDLQGLINRYGFDAEYETPDYLLAEHLFKCLVIYGATLNKTRKWHGWPTLAERHRAMFKETITHDTEGGPDVG